MDSTFRKALWFQYSKKTSDFNCVTNFNSSRVSINCLCTLPHSPTHRSSMSGQHCLNHPFVSDNCPSDFVPVIIVLATFDSVTFDLVTFDLLTFDLVTFDIHK